MDNQDNIKLWFSVIEDGNVIFNDDSLNVTLNYIRGRQCVILAANRREAENNYSDYDVCYDIYVQ